MTNDHVRSEVRLDVQCAGAPLEMGLAQGAALAAAIAAADRTVDQLEALRLKCPRWLPWTVFRRTAERRAARFLRRALIGDNAGMADRLRGLAEGAAFPRRKLALMNALEPVLASIADATELPGGGACTALAVRGTRSAAGGPIIARNFDYLPLVQPFYVLRESRPRSGYRALEFTVAPLAGAIDGINEHGLCITYNYAFTVDTPAPAPPVSYRITEALARCATVEQAADRLLAATRWGSGLLMLADAGGDIASLELSHTRAQLRRAADGEDVLFHSNCFHSARMCEVQIDPRRVYADRAPQALRRTRPLQSPRRRDARLRELVARTGPFGPDELAALMSDHGAEDRPGADTICMHSGYWNTTACLQWFPASRSVRVAYAPACCARYTEFRLD